MSGMNTCQGSQPVCVVQIISNLVSAYLSCVARTQHKLHAPLLVTVRLHVISARLVLPCVH